MNIEQLQATRIELEDKRKAASHILDELRRELRETESKIAHELCPFEKGQKIKSINTGKIMFVGDISYRCITNYSPDGYTFRVHKMKKDGTAYTNQQHIWGYGTSDFVGYAEEK